MDAPAHRFSFLVAHWENVIEPFLSALDRGPLIEIGAATGAMTAKLAEFVAERDLVLHSIDPAPSFDVTEYERRFGPHFRFHRARSHDALERIGPAAAVVIDGDHNWYTVHGELTRLERIAKAARCHFPLTLLHDVEWPYARRDMYYEPEAIPTEMRKPWARRGIELGESELLDTPDGGLNPSYANAIEEGGLRNGVLTAVEDFRQQSEVAPQLRIFRGEFGLGLLVSDQLIASSDRLRRQWQAVHTRTFLLAEAERLSSAATAQGFARLMLMRELSRLGAEGS